jgi:7-keto-8-aminopelargonate synthetase and related enzymes
MCAESRKAQELSSLMRDEGVMVGAIVFPMVARDMARVRTQMSAGLSRDELDSVLESFDRCGRKIGLI